MHMRRPHLFKGHRLAFQRLDLQGHVQRRIHTGASGVHTGGSGVHTGVSGVHSGPSGVHTGGSG